MSKSEINELGCALTWVIFVVLLIAALALARLI